MPAPVTHPDPLARARRVLREIDRRPTAFHTPVGDVYEIIDALKGAVKAADELRRRLDDAMTEWQARDRDFAWRSTPWGIELYVDGHAQLIRIRRLEVHPAKADPATCEHPSTDRLLIRDRLTECGLCGTTLAYYTDPRPAGAADAPAVTGGAR